MMPGYGGGMGGWGFLYMSLGTLLFLALIGVVVWLATRAGGAGSSLAPTAPAPREILAERYARGEIDEKEYQQRLHTLGA